MIPVIPEGSAAHGDDESDAGAAAASTAGAPSTAGSDAMPDAVAAPPGADAVASSSQSLYIRRSSAGSSQSRDTDRGPQGQGQGPLSPMSSPISMVAQVASAALVRGVSWSTQPDAAAAGALSPPWPGAALPPPATGGSSGVQQRPLQATGSQSSLHAAADGGWCGWITRLLLLLQQTLAPANAMRLDAARRAVKSTCTRVLPS